MTTTPRNLHAVDKLPSESSIDDLRSAVKAAIDGMAWLGPTDEALKALALQYAELIDNAAPAAKYRKALAVLMHAVDAYDDEGEAGEALQTVAMALSEHSVASNLGPKLQAVLRDLGATPATRKALQGGTPKGGHLAQFRAGAANPAG